MRDICGHLIQTLRAGEKVALATVVRTAGPTPRGVGTRMAIRRGGEHLGTVGGGCGEAEVVRAGLTVLDTGVPRWVRADLTEEVTHESEAACGGTMDFLIVSYGAELLPVLEVMQRAAAARRAVRLLTCLAPGPALGAMLVADEERRAWTGMDEGTARILAEHLGDPGPGPSARQLSVPVRGETWPVLLEEIPPLPLLVVCGGGHIALPLVRMAKLLDLAVVVIDDRPSFASQSRFPEADRVVCAPFSEALTGFPLDRDTYVVVVTRGHRHDLECVRQVLGRGAGYVGMIGSRRRVAGVLELLRAEGVGEEVLAELHAPIGLDLGAETPGEIALSILAEIVQTRRGGSGRSLRLSARRGVAGGTA